MFSKCLALSFLLSLIPPSFCVATADVSQRDQSELRVFALNVWQEGTVVGGGFDMIVDLIIESKADIVALAEVRNYHGKDFHKRLIATLEEKGHTFQGQYVGGDAGLISRFPITKTKNVFSTSKQEDAGSLLAYHIEIAPNLTLIIGSAHLDYRNFATYSPRGYHHSTFEIIDPDGDGEPNPETNLKTVLQIDKSSQRGPAIEAFVAYTKAHNLDGSPAILMGDFNECSHLDWTEETKDLFSHNGMVIPWSNSIFLMENGFVDAYRELHPNPVTHPGATWPSDAEGQGSTSWAPQCDERDRIDFVYYNRGRLQAQSSVLAGSAQYYVFNKLVTPVVEDGFTLQDLPWPTDHKGVIVDFRVTQAK